MLNIVEYRKNEFEVLNEDLNPSFMEYLGTRLWFSPLLIFLSVLLLVLGLVKSGIYLTLSLIGVVLIWYGIRTDPFNLMKQEAYDRIRNYGVKLVFNTEREFQKMVAYRIVDSLTGGMKEVDINTRQAIGYRIVNAIWEYQGNLPFSDPISRKIDEFNKNTVLELGYQIEILYSETQPGIPLIELFDLEETCQLIHVFDKIFPNKTFFPPQEKTYSGIDKIRYSSMDNDTITEINEMINETEYPEPFKDYFKKFVYMD